MIAPVRRISPELEMSQETNASIGVWLEFGDEQCLRCERNHETSHDSCWQVRREEEPFVSRLHHYRRHDEESLEVVVVGTLLLDSRWLHYG